MTHVEITTLETAAHVALLDLLSGEGLLVLPLPVTDVPSPAPAELVALLTEVGPVLAVAHLATLHEADLRAMLSKLEAHGWEPTEDEWGDLFYSATTDSGRTVVGLFCPDPVMTNPDRETIGKAASALLCEARKVL